MPTKGEVMKCSKTFTDRFTGVMPRFYRTAHRIDYGKSFSLQTLPLSNCFQEILKAAGCHPVNGKKKGGIKAHTLIKADEDVPQMVHFTAGAANDTTFLKHIALPKGSILVF
jgi:hypothetical protein